MSNAKRNQLKQKNNISKMVIYWFHLPIVESLCVLANLAGCN